MEDQDYVGAMPLLTIMGIKSRLGILEFVNGHLPAFAMASLMLIAAAAVADSKLLKDW